MDEAAKNAAATMIQERAESLLRERAGIREDRTRLDQRDRAIDRDLADCVAAARLFGVPLTLPTEKPASGDFVRTIQALNQAISHSMGSVRNEIAHNGVNQAWTKWIASQSPSPASKPELEIPPATPTNAVIPPMPAVKGGMPKIRDIVLDRLRAAPEGRGVWALEIRRYITHTYGAQIHPKTVGMTLFRLSKERLVHRIGQKWFFGPALSAETKNPGGGTPGSVQPLLEVGKEA